MSDGSKREHILERALVTILNEVDKLDHAADCSYGDQHEYEPEEDEDPDDPYICICDMAGLVKATEEARKALKS